MERRWFWTAPMELHKIAEKVYRGLGAEVITIEIV